MITGPRGREGNMRVELQTSEVNNDKIMLVFRKTADC